MRNLSNFLYVGVYINPLAPEPFSTSLGLMGGGPVDPKMKFKYKVRKSTFSCNYKNNMDI